MEQIAYFIQKYKYFLFFLFLEIVALLLTIQSNSYHKSLFVNSANSITGGFFDTTNTFFKYTSLKKENELLAEENAILRNRLELNPTDLFFHEIDSIKQKNIFYSAKVINNNYSKQNNFLTINKGSLDGLSIDMGVINHQGIIGVINNISDNYATVLSILNSNSKINVRLKNSHYFGTLAWNGKDYKVSQLHDMQRQAPIHIGDTIVSGGKSTLFPEGIPIGIINDFEKSNKKYKTINVQLFNDMSNIGYVQIVVNTQKDEILNLENQNE